jgi:hypothetical protein
VFFLFWFFGESVFGAGGSDLVALIMQSVLFIEVIKAF